MAEQTEIFKCSSYRMQHRIDGFDTNRLGKRYKSCALCRKRSQRQREKKKHLEQMQISKGNVEEEHAGCWEAKYEEHKNSHEDRMREREEEREMIYQIEEACIYGRGDGPQRF